MINNKELAAVYVECGKRIGFFWAENLLMKYLPANKPDGKCFNVPQKNRAAFMAELKTYEPAVNSSKPKKGKKK